MENPLFEYIYVFFCFIFENYFPKKKYLDNHQLDQKTPHFLTKFIFSKHLKDDSIGNNSSRIAHVQIYIMISIISI